MSYNDEVTQVVSHWWTRFDLRPVHVGFIVNKSGSEPGCPPCNYLVPNEHHSTKGKGKAILLEAWTGPEGSRRLRLPDFKTIST
jgi:hypothetical protein